jgi:hypothetical protein
MKGMCDCAMSKAAPLIANDKDKELLTRVIRGKAVPVNEADLGREIASYWVTVLSTYSGRGRYGHWQAAPLITQFRGCLRQAISRWCG